MVRALEADFKKVVGIRYFFLKTIKFYLLCCNFVMQIVIFFTCYVLDNDTACTVTKFAMWHNNLSLRKNYHACLCDLDFCNFSSISVGIFGFSWSCFYCWMSMVRSASTIGSLNFKHISLYLGINEWIVIISSNILNLFFILPIYNCGFFLLDRKGIYPYKIQYWWIILRNQYLETKM